MSGVGPSDGQNDHHAPSQNSLKRPRPVISCLECRRKKLKCSRTLPCQQCVKAKRADACSFQPGQEPELRLSDGEDEVEDKRRRLRDPHRPNDIAGDSKTAFERLEQRVAYLETFVGVTALTGSGSPQRQRQHGAPATTPMQHWSSTPSRLRQSMPSDVFPNASAFISTWCAPDACNNHMKKVAGDLKLIHQSLKILHRQPAFTHPTATQSSILRLIPSHAVCRVLSEIYFDNLEVRPQLLFPGRPPHELMNEALF
jgi:hypothetical protein